MFARSFSPATGDSSFSVMQVYIIQSFPVVCVFSRFGSIVLKVSIQVVRFSLVPMILRVSISFSLLVIV